ncbi:unnamed protein product [Dovyalis caffra]|uniref:Disease resistance protein At4g27190-like leucine-rich repeats domain-containing protein n=1 Tax=Dovyalis caffra TaxID=77055 RepID=A0AAV1RRG5_9ROSI|nr:unnamed protein product [Dovyalis caffra]
MAIESVGEFIISKIAEHLVEPTIRQFHYLFCFINFLQEFNEQKQNLTLAHDRLQNAERNAEEIEKDGVLFLKGGCLSLESLQCSTNLQSQQFIECECMGLISLRKLQRLKILGFLKCLSIEELPEAIGELENLRLLDLTGCRRLERIRVNLIGSTVSQLELNQVSGLKNLMLFQRLEFVEVMDCGDLGTLFSEKSWRALKNLRSVRIYGCCKLEEVFELVAVEEVSDEEKVSLSKCIWKGPTRQANLQRFTYLKLWNLFKLNHKVGGSKSTTARNT